ASRRDHLTSASLVDHPSRWRTRRTSITLLPYTTLFRSASRWPSSLRGKNFSPMNICRTDEAEFFVSEYLGARWLSRRAAHSVGRSEEHTSELQSRFDLVCRLLLEKNNGGEAVVCDKSAS